MKNYLILTSILFLTVSCSHPQEREPIKGIASLVDKIKDLLGFKPANHEITPTTASTQAQGQAQVHSTELSPAPTPSTPPSPPQEVSPPTPEAISQPTLPLDQRVATYRAFEEKLIAEENKKIEEIESSTNKQIEELMQDSRVVEVTRTNPDINFNELPQDIHKRARDLIESEEKSLTDIMDATDKVLLEEAMKLDVHEHVAQDELNRDMERQKHLDNLKKVENHLPAAPNNQTSPLTQEAQASSSETQTKQG